MDSNGNTIAFFDFPGLALGAYQEVLGGLLLQGIGLRVRSLALQDAEHILHRHDCLALDAFIGT
jgi:hypothetical protein